MLVRALKSNYFVLLLALFAILILVIQNEFVIHLFIMIFTSATLGLAWNIIGGYGGQLSLGHAAFYGIGAYTSTMLFIQMGVSPWLGMIVGGLLAMVAALVLGIPCFRLRGTYFTLATIAFAEVLRILCVHYKEFTEGSMGIALRFQPGMSNLMFENKEAYAYISLGFMAILYYLSLLIERSTLGYYLISLKENEEGARALGVNTYRVKLIALMISAFVTALIGSFFAQYILYINPEAEFSLFLSIFITLPVMIGGLGTAIGPVVGSFFIAPLRELPSLFIGGQYQGLQNIIFGVILILIVIWMPQGIVRWARARLFQRDR